MLPKGEQHLHQFSLTRTRTIKQSLAGLKKGSAVRGKEKKYRKRWKSGWNQQNAKAKKKVAAVIT